MIQVRDLTVAKLLSISLFLLAAANLEALVAAVAADSELDCFCLVLAVVVDSPSNSSSEIIRTYSRYN